jgi:hypothetical protein
MRAVQCRQITARARSDARMVGKRQKRALEAANKKDEE